MISPMGVALGHGYADRVVNAPCRRCASDTYADTGRHVTVLDCRYDFEEDE